MSNGAPPDARPWWWGPGPAAFAVVILVACVAVGWEGYASARRPVDLRQRDQQLLRGGAFCDTPTPPVSTAAPPPPAAAQPGPAGRR